MRLAANQRREGMYIWLRLRQPMPLKTALAQMEGVSSVDTPDESSADGGERQLQVHLG